MTISTRQAREHLRNFDFRKLFIEELGWNIYNQRISTMQFSGSDLTYSFAPIAEQGGMIVVQCESSDRNIPPSGRRKEIHKQISKQVHENIIIFVDGDRATSLWMWVKRVGGKDKVRDYTHRREQSGDALLQRLAGIAFSIEELDDLGQISIATVTSRVQQAFDVERVTRRFYDTFKTEHAAFLKLLKGIEDADDRAWYTSVMLNRLMFLYFIQSKGFLNGDHDYLRTKLAESQAHKKDHYYKDFLTPLFFSGLALDEAGRGREINELLGHIPYLNGGLFLSHEIEDRYGGQIDIPDAAFERLFEFFADYQWHLDDRPLSSGKEINPDVLGYIFEKYINQKQMGAYYTKEDITGYICTYTIIPFLFEKVGLDVHAVMTEVEPYIYEAVSTEEYLPTETEREYAARHERYQSILNDFSAGKIASVNDLVTYNLDIRALAEDWLRALDNPLTLRCFYFECLTKLTVLDPTCGSGAFLFAAMNILETLYELSIDRMQHFVKEKTVAFKYPDFVQELERIDGHPNRRYFVFKSIIINNLYGVDIMEEAVEIAKLRLFLKLVAQVETMESIEPLPDIDFNIQAGNTLVGFATQGEITGRLFATTTLLHQVQIADQAMAKFRDRQTRLGTKPIELQQAKTDIRRLLAEIRKELDRSLMQDYGRDNLDQFRRTHQPFHWYVEFNHVLANGGFDVIVGNPPFVEYNKVRSNYTIKGYETERCGNLYAFIMERTISLASRESFLGLIVPIAITSVTDTVELRAILLREFHSYWMSNFAIRPAKLFEGVEQRLTIFLGANDGISQSRLFSTKYHQWYVDERPFLLSKLEYCDVRDLSSKAVIPKAGSVRAATIIHKVLQQTDRRVAHHLRENGVHKLFFHRTPGYWIRIMNFEPYFRSPTSTRSIHHIRELAVGDLLMAKFIGAIVSSSLYFFWFFAMGNCRNLTLEDVKAFPIGKPGVALLQTVGQLFDNLMADYQANSFINQRGVTEFQEFNWGLSKSIIDEIDQVLAQHYGFTNEELDFIINYDIKYRMGRDGEGEED